MTPLPGPSRFGRDGLALAIAIALNLAASRRATD
jgi:hypothetical protein